MWSFWSYTSWLECLTGSSPTDTLAFSSKAGGCDNTVGFSTLGAWKTNHAPLSHRGDVQSSVICEEVNVGKKMLVMENENSKKHNTFRVRSLGPQKDGARLRSMRGGLWRESHVYSSVIQINDTALAIDAQPTSPFQDSTATAVIP